MLDLIGTILCPHTQRVAIVLAEKGVPFTRTELDPRAPASPTRTAPQLRVDGVTLFDSAAICEYLDETIAPRLLPEGALGRARHRGYVALAAAALDDVAAMYLAPDRAGYQARRDALRARISRMVAELGDNAPYFAGERFGMVDAAFAPVFRAVGVMDPATCEDSLDGSRRLEAWRDALMARPSVRDAVGPDFGDRLMAMLRAKASHLGGLMAAGSACRGFG